ncbi:OFA family oxalate/formate antiporter-like MFS transporter [Clostridiales Family XIII bacterium PM5-7]
MSNQVKASKSNFGAKGWFVIIFSFLCILLQSSLINDSLNVVIEVFAESRGWSINSLYAYSSICSAISVLGAAFWGFVSNKTNIRFAWGISLTITAVACFFWGSAQSSTIYLVCLAVSSVCGMAFCYIANMNVISNWFPRKKGIAMGWVTIGFPFSASITTPLVTGLLEAGGLEKVYTTYAIVAAVFAVIAFAFVRDYPEQAGAYPDNDKSYSKEDADKALAAGLEYMKTSPWKPAKLFKTATVWKMAFSLGVLELLSLGIMTNFMPRFLQAGYQPPEIIKMLAIAGILACFGSYACGLLDAKVGSKKAIMITQVVAIVAIVLNIIPTKITVYASLPFLAMMLGGASNYLVSLANTIWGRYDFPMAYKVLKPMVALVGACGVAITGIIGQSVSYVVAYGVLGGLAALALIVMIATPDTYVGRTEDDVEKLS